MSAEPTIDELITLIATGKQKPGPNDGQQVRAHIGAAPFNRETRVAEAWGRLGESVVGCPHPSDPTKTIDATTSISSLEYHVAKRIQDGQWRAITKPADYEADCQRTATSASVVKAGVRLVPLAATQTRLTTEAFPLVNVVPGQVLLVVYDTVKKRITTCYYLLEANAALRVYKFWIQKPRPVVLPVRTP